MTLIKNKIKLELKEAFYEANKMILGDNFFNSLSEKEIDKVEKRLEEASDKFSDIASNSIDSYIKSANIVIPRGQSVRTTGSSTIQTGVTTNNSPSARIS